MLNQIREPSFLAWLFHRISGIGIFLFITLHIIDTIIVKINPKLYDTIMKFYLNPLIKTGEIILLGMIFFHAFNGIRIIIMDLFPKTTDYHKQSFLIVCILWAFCFFPVMFLILK